MQENNNNNFGRHAKNAARKIQSKINKKLIKKLLAMFGTSLFTVFFWMVGIFLIIFLISILATSVFLIFSDGETERRGLDQTWAPKTELTEQAMLEEGRDLNEPRIAQGLDAFYQSYYEEAAKIKHNYIRKTASKDSLGVPISYKKETKTKEDIRDFNAVDETYKIPAALLYSLDSIVLVNDMYPQWFAQEISETNDFENAGVNTKFIYSEDVKYEKIQAAFTQKEVCVKQDDGSYTKKAEMIEEPEEYSKKIENSEVDIYKLDEARTFKADFVNTYSRTDNFYRDLNDAVSTNKYDDNKYYEYDKCTWTTSTTNSKGELVTKTHSIPLYYIKEGAIMLNEPFLENTQKANEREEYIYDYLFKFKAKMPRELSNQRLKIERDFIEKEKELEDKKQESKEEGQIIETSINASGNYNFDINDLSKKSGIKTVEEMKQVIKKGCSQENIKSPLEDNAELLLKLEEQENINALFLVGLAKTETNCGRDGVGKSKKNIYSYGGGGQKKYPSYEKAITTAVKGISKNYVKSNGKYYNNSPGLCSMTGIYCQSGCNSWIPGIIGTIERIGVNSNVNAICYTNNIFMLDQKLLELAKKEVKLGLFDINIEREISDIDVDLLLVLTKAMMDKKTLSSAETESLTFFDKGFDPNSLNNFYFEFNIWGQLAKDAELIEENLTYIIISSKEILSIDNGEVAESVGNKLKILNADGSILTLEDITTNLKKGDKVKKGDVLGNGENVKVFFTTADGTIKNGKILLQSSFDVEGQRAVIVQAAQKLIGSSYVWGSKGPSTFDCSGFTYHIYKLAGIKIGTSTTMQRSEGNRVDLNELKPGDLVHFNSNASATGRHVGMFLGIENGEPMMIHAGSSRTGVVKASMSWWINKGLFLYGSQIIP